MSTRGRKPTTDKYTPEERERRRQYQNNWYKQRKLKDPLYLSRRAEWRRNRRDQLKQEKFKAQYKGKVDLPESNTGVSQVITPIGDDNFQFRLKLYTLLTILNELEFTGKCKYATATMSRARKYAMENGIPIEWVCRDKLLHTFQYKCYVKSDKEFRGPIADPSRVIMLDVEAGKTVIGTKIAITRQLIAYQQSLARYERQLIKEAQQNAKRELRGGDKD